MARPQKVLYAIGDIVELGINLKCHYKDGYHFWDNTSDDRWEVVKITTWKSPKTGQQMNTYHLRNLVDRNETCEEMNNTIKGKCKGSNLLYA